MEKVCIVPFTKKEFALAEHLKKKYKLFLVTLEGIGVEGQDVSILRNMQPTGLVFSNTLNLLKNSDKVIITDIPDEDHELREFALHAIEVALSEKKKIISFLDISLDEKKQLMYRYPWASESCTFFSDIKSKCADGYDTYMLSDVDAPILVVAEAVPGCDGYDVFLKITKSLRNRGKKVLAISDDKYNWLLDVQYSKLFENSSIEESIYKVNHIISQSIENVRPDIVIIKMPLPPMKYNSKEAFDAGVGTYVVSQAVPISGCIFCTDYSSISASVWEDFDQMMSIRFGMHIVGLHTSNCMIDATGNNPLAIVHVPIQKVRYRVNQMRQQSGLPYYWLLSDEDSNKMVNIIESEFLNLPYGVI